MGFWEIFFAKIIYLSRTKVRVISHIKHFKSGFCIYIYIILIVFDCVYWWRYIILSLSLNHYNKDYLLTTPSVNNIMQFACFNSILSWKYKHCWILRDGVGCLDERRDKFIYFGSSINNPMSAFSKWLDPNVYYFARILLCPKIRAFFSISLVAR